MFIDTGVMISYDTVTEAMKGLAERGYNLDFTVQPDCIFCDEKGMKLKAEEFEVDEVYRFEGDSDPGDENVVYAISSHDNSVKGIVVHAFGVYAEEASIDLLKKLHYDPKHK